MAENKTTTETDTATGTEPEATAGTPTGATPEKADTPEEFGGPKGPEPTRYSDWEQKGRCTDF